MGATIVRPALTLVLLVVHAATPYDPRRRENKTKVGQKTTCSATAASCPNARVVCACGRRPVRRALPTRTGRIVPAHRLSAAVWRRSRLTLRDRLAGDIFRS